jgi:hypothetical protein
MANLVYNRGKYLAAQINSSGSVLQAMLVTTSYVADQDHNFVNANTSAGSLGEPKVYELTVGGYARQTLASLATFEDDTNDFAGLDAADLTFAALAAGQTVGGCVVYRYSTSGGTSGGTQTTGDSGQELLAFYDVTDTPTNGGDIGIQWASTSAGGVLKFGTTS